MAHATREPWVNANMRAKGKKVRTEDVTMAGQWKSGRHHGFDARFPQMERDMKEHGIWRATWKKSMLYWPNGRVMMIDFKYGSFVYLRHLWESVRIYKIWLLEKKVEEEMKATAWKRVTVASLQRQELLDEAMGQSRGIDISRIRLQWAER